MNPTTLLSGLGAAITADPSLGGASTTGRESNPGGGDLFLALVNGLLQGSSQEDLGVVPGPTSGTPGEATTPGLAPSVAAGATPVPATTDEAPAAADTDPPVEVPTDLSMLPIALAAQPALLAAATSGSGDQGGPAATVVSSDATPATPAAPTTVAGDSAQANAGSTADQQGDGNPPPSDASASTPTETPDQAATTAPSAPSAPRVEARADAVPTQPAGVAAAIAPATPASTVAAPTTSAALPRVADQVFPEVLRAASNPDNGTSRVTVKLNPESLGEVRVVLTQRGGELQVTLAGGADARRAMTEGAPELRRLLESVGRADSRIFIRDLPTAGPAPVPAASGAPARTDVSTDLAGGAWSGAGSPGGEPAPDRDSSRHRPGSSTATDGIPGVTPRSRPIQTAERTHAGLDLSM